MNQRRWTLAVMALVCSCGEPLTPTDAGMAGGSAGGGGAGGGSTDAGCQPTTCGASCGMVPDGCGGMLSCGACQCTPSTFATDCPAGPCTVATGCQDNRCVYGPVSCGGSSCEACPLSQVRDGGCLEPDLRACGSACVASFCDPAPLLMGPRVVFRNQCRAREEVRCGLCELGGLSCTDGGLSCDVPAIPDVNPAVVECNGASPAAVVVFVDPTFDGGASTGARTAPYRDFPTGLREAARRGSRGVILGGSPVFEQTLDVQNGVSVLGGFAPAPTFFRDATQRPVFAPPLVFLDAGVVPDGGLVGVTAQGITTGTLLAGFEVRVPAIPVPAPRGQTGANTIGVWVKDSPALALAGLPIDVRSAQEGGSGEPAPTPVAQTPVSLIGVANTLCPSLPNNRFVISQGGQGQASTCDGVVAPTSRGGDGASLSAEALTNGSVVYRFWVSTGTVGPTNYSTRNNLDGVAATSPAPAATASAQPSLRWDQAVPVMTGTGQNGPSGAPGAGGEGATAQVGSRPGCDPVFFTPGGAGGAGGCGGRGGRGGAPGGIAAGLVIVGADAPRLSDILIRLPLRAPGGQGSAGSPGTPGALGGQLPPPRFQPELTGGRGAVGQTGGAGAPGATGFVRGVLCERPVTLTAAELRFIFPPDAGMTDGGFRDFDGCL